MALLQNDDFTIYHLRSTCISTIKDGIGERLITVNPAVFNTPGFRSAGWYPNTSEIKRTYSPPIPTAIASEYFQAPPRSAGLTPAGFGADEDEDGGMVTGGGGSGDTVGPGLVTRRRRRREQMEAEDSSDLSDDSDDADGMQRAAQQIRFAKMPVRNRSGSSPIRGSNMRDGPSLMVTSPSRPSPASRLRRGSLGAVEAVKQRARRDTTTSSEMSSENELDPSIFKRKQINASSAARATKALEDTMAIIQRQNTKESTDLEDEDETSGGESDGSAMSSEFAETADSPSFLNGVGVENSSISSPMSRMRGGPEASQHAANNNPSPRKTRQNPALLQALPPPRPISTVQPVSALSMAIKAKRSKSDSPFDRFATLSGKGDPNPLNLRIYAPFSKTPTKPYEVPMRRVMREDSGFERKVNVVDAIGLSLWRYAEDKIEPELAGDKMNVNRWTLRMVEDDEVDFDFPALERTKPLTDFTSNNNRAVRARSNAKMYDEFALVAADDDQYKENQRLTPNPVQESTIAEESEEITPQPSPGPAITQIRRNPILGPSYNHASALRPNAPGYQGPPQPVDAPQAVTSHATPRTGASRIIKIHLTSLEGYPELVALDVTSDTYLAEILETVCKKRNLERAHHILRITGHNIIAPLDRVVESLGDHTDIDLVRKRFGNDGVGFIAGSPGTSTPPNAPLIMGSLAALDQPARRTNRTGLGVGRRGMGILNPLNTGASSTNAAAAAAAPPVPDFDPASRLHSSADYQKFTVWRKQPMSFMPTHERVLALDGEYLHVMPGETGKSTIFDSNGKTTTIHFSSIIGCKCSRKHPSNFSIVVSRGLKNEQKRYDFEARSGEEAKKIVQEVKKGMGTWGGEEPRLMGM